MNQRPVLTVLLTLTLAQFARCDSPERDREAILAMSGHFTVEFNFKETLRFDASYKLRPPSQSEVTELVLITENSPTRVALSHVMLFNNRLIEHWHQIWTYQDLVITEYQGGEEWKDRNISPAEAKGAWSQLVTGSGGGPRYESYAAWTHENGVSAWKSRQTNRPLPRRDSGRSDYQILVAVNRHSITPDGWAHEQDNAKLAVDGDSRRLLAREAGFNYYDRVPEPQLGEFWPKALKIWQETARAHENFALVEEVDGGSLWERLGELVNRAKNPEFQPGEEVRKLLEQHRAKS